MKLNYALNDALIVNHLPRWIQLRTCYGEKAQCNMTREWSVHISIENSKHESLYISYSEALARLVSHSSLNS